MAAPADPTDGRTPPDPGRDARARWIARTLAAAPPMTAPVAARIALLLMPVYQRTVERRSTTEERR